MPLNENPTFSELSRSLFITITSFIILLLFLIFVTWNIFKLFKNFYYNYETVNGTNEEYKKIDDNVYIENEQNYNNNYEEILKSIKSIRKDYNNEFNNLINYKKEKHLNSELNSEINSKVLSSKYDNYAYKEPPNIIDFTLDIFKPTIKSSHYEVERDKVIKSEK
jgi:hypothetical protein